MTAEHLVKMLLDAENPKAFLRSLPHGPRLPSIDQVEFECDAEWEEDDPAGSFTEDEDVALVRAQIEAGNVWGWASVTVTARYETEDGVSVEGHDYLGGCSYPSRADFMEPGGYYDGMKKESYAALCKKLEKLGYH